MKRGIASRFLAGSLLAVLVASPGTAWSHTYGTEGPAPTGPEPGAVPDVVTLITGDVVRVLGERAVSVTSAPRHDGHTPNFSVQSPPAKDAAAHELYVIPDDALPLIEQGRLDRSLFDVQLLRSNGFGVTRAIPAITTFPEKTGRASLLERGQELAASTATHALHSVHATALTVPVDKAAAFWRELTAGEPAGKAGVLGSGVERLLLDRPVRALLDKSVPQVRAPEAWKAGFDGTGVKVAVLDTGIDETHPDLAGKVVASESFVAGEPVADGYGHGTHVASIVAGTGAASGGADKGVAPGARLVVGKVLGNDGSGLTSGIIAGMEWATAQGARVVNLSLGGPAPAEESEDLMAAAVNRLTASSGALFVIAAGNEGSAASTVASPGVAESALTVAAVDSADRTADFSSRGPLPYDYTRVLKPDIAAPGVAIAAARAAGTSMGTPVDDHYTRASGTSMATPHVAGAAAVLAQRRPGWTAAELKHALTASAAEIAGSAFEVGSGRLDVAAAIEQTVVSKGALDLGRSDVPSTDKVTRTLAYTATGSEDVALTIKASLRDATTGAPAPDGAFTVPGTVAVPGGGEASVQVTLDPARLPEGRYTGTVTATDANGRIVRTAVGFVREPETTKLVVWITDHNGLPCKTYGSVDCSASSGVQAMNLDDPAHSAVGTPGEPFRLRPGRYALAANVSFALDREQHVAVLALPEVRVAVNPLGVQSARMSLSAARQVRVQTDRPSETYSGTLKFQRRVGEWSDYNAWITGYDNSSMWALPASPPTVGQYLLTADLQRGAIPVNGSVVSGETMKLTPRYDTYADLVPKFPASVRARLVDVGATLEPAEAAKLSGAIALVRPKRIPLLDLDASFLDPDQEAALADAGAIGALVWSPDMAIGVPGTTMTDRRIPVAGLPGPEGDRLAQRLADGPVTVKLTGGPASPYLYSLKFYERDTVGSLQYRVGDRELAQVPVDHRTHGPGKPEVWRYNLSTWPAAGESDSITAGVLSFAPARSAELIG
ncbi:MAG: S8 family serine peptidase, partial [Nonomuraea sp.]|nr:S8 family serine peptidase [Nonomuraea sp.]